MNEPPRARRCPSFRFSILGSLIVAVLLSPFLFLGASTWWWPLKVVVWIVSSLLLPLMPRFLRFRRCCPSGWLKRHAHRTRMWTMARRLLMHATYVGACLLVPGLVIITISWAASLLAKHWNNPAITSVADPFLGFLEYLLLVSVLCVPLLIAVTFWWAFVFVPSHWPSLSRDEHRGPSREQWRVVLSGCLQIALVFALLAQVLLLFRYVGFPNWTKGAVTTQPVAQDVLSYIGLLFALLGIMLTVITSLGVWFIKSAQDSVKNALADIDKAKEENRQARSSLASLVAGSIIPNPWTQSYESSLCLPLHSLEPVLKLALRAKATPGDGLANLRYVSVMNGLIRKKYIDCKFHPTVDDQVDNGLGRRCRILELVVHRQDLIDEKAYSGYVPMRMNDDPHPTTRLAAATFVFVAAREDLASGNREGATEKLARAKDLLEDGRLSSMAAVEAYRIKVKAMLHDLVEADGDGDATVRENGQKALLERCKTYIENFADDFLQEKDPGIKCNYLSVLAWVTELILYHVCLAVGEGAERVKAMEPSVWKRLRPVKSDSPEDWNNVEEANVEIAEVADIGLQLCKEAETERRDIEDSEYHVLSEVTDRFVPQQELVDDIARMRECFTYIKNNVNDDGLIEGGEQEEKMRELHRRIWIPGGEKLNRSRRRVINTVVPDEDGRSR